MGVSAHFGYAENETGRELRSSGTAELSARYVPSVGHCIHRLESCA